MEVVAVLQDIEALAPPVIVAVACLVGVVALVRRELAPKRKGRERDRGHEEGASGDQRQPTER